MRMARAGRSTEPTRVLTNPVTMIGRAGEVIAGTSCQNPTPDATGQQRGVATATVTKGVLEARGPRGRVREIEVATAGEGGGTPGHPQTQTHLDGGGGVRALQKPTAVTRGDTK